MSKVSKFSPEWAIIRAWLKEKIEAGHNYMDGGVSMEEYHFTRGQIALAKALIEEVEPTTPPVTVEDTYGMSDPE